MRQVRLHEGDLTKDDRDGIQMTSLPTKFYKPNIEWYNGMGCLKIHLRLYSTIMRVHGLDDAQLVTLFPMSLSKAAYMWFVSVEPSRLYTQIAFNVDIDVPDES